MEEEQERKEVSVTYANHWDAAKLLSGMTEEQREWVKQEIALRHLACTVLERPYNKGLYKFVNKRLNG